MSDKQSEDLPLPTNHKPGPAYPIAHDLTLDQGDMASLYTSKHLKKLRLVKVVHIYEYKIRKQSMACPSDPR